MITWLLSIVFPPKLPSRIRGWEAPVEDRPEQGSARLVPSKPYRNGIERHFAENS